MIIVNITLLGNTIQYNIMLSLRHISKSVIVQPDILQINTPDFKFKSLNQLLIQGELYASVILCMNKNESATFGGKISKCARACIASIHHSLDRLKSR